MARSLPSHWAAQRRFVLEGHSHDRSPPADVISEHATWELESIDRMYCNVYVPQLQREGGVVAFFRKHRGYPFASSALMDPVSKAFVAAIHNRLVRKWRARLPHPFPAADRRAGYRYDVSILQAEFSLTQVDRPTTGRVSFEEVIRENLDVGRPDRVQLIFGRRVTRRTPGRFRTRVLTEGVTPRCTSTTLSGLKSTPWWLRKSSIPCG